MVLAMAAIVLLASCHKESSEKKILSFSFASPAVEATVAEDAKTIVAVVPEGTLLTNLVPIIVISEKATVVPASGTVVDFTNPVDFTVTAEDGSTVVYKATVTVENGGGGGGGGGVDPNDPTTWSGAISANTTWKDKGLDVDYIIDGWTWIEGNACLTIEPGVTIMFTGTDGGLEVGENAGLKMIGTAEKPIRLVNPTNNNNVGAWRGIRINSKRSDNQFEYVQFINGGADHPVIYNRGTLSMKHCLIDGGQGNGIDLQWDGEFTAFENNTIKNVDYPLWMDSFKKVNALGNGNSYVNNTNNMINMCIYWLDDNSNVTFNNQGIPYYMSEGLNVYNNSKMIVDAGVEFVFDYEKEFVVSDDCRLEVNGTASQPVIFRAKDAENPWSGLAFYSSRTGNVINYAKIMNCGLDEYGAERCCLYIGSEAKLTLTNNVFGPSNYYGVAIQYLPNWGNVTHSGNTFTDCAIANVIVETGGDWNGTEVPDEVTFTELP